jgi:hypothetical protein
MWARLGSTVRRSYDNGNLFFGIAAMSLAGGAATYWRDQKQEAEASKLGALRFDMNSLASQQEEARNARAKALPTDPALFQARVMRRVIGTWAFDGPTALTVVGVGDVVDVLEEDTGPDKSYHRCRGKTQAGLYPKHFLERVGNDGQALPTGTGGES